MQLKEYQEQVLEKLDRYLEILKNEYLQEKKEVDILKEGGVEKSIKEYCKKTWDTLNESGQLPLFTNKKGQKESLPYLDKEDGAGEIIPNICIKVPTGGGKTLLGVSAVERINFDYFSKTTGFVLWIVPTDAIYRQTVQNFKNRDHPYRKVLERASGGRVKILQKNDSFNALDLRDYLCVMTLMLQSANRETKESLRVFKDSGRFINFFPQPDDYEANENLLEKVSNLDVYTDNHVLGGLKGVSVKQSLGNALRILRPIVILDEGHRAYSDLARKTVCGLNPRFILELSATPNMKNHLSNVLVSVSGVKLKEEEMIKLPINVTTSARADWKKTLCQAYEKLVELEKDAKKYFATSKKYIRPIMLVQVERTGKDQREQGKIHAEDVREYLTGKLNVPEEAVRAKISGKDELKDENLLHETSQVQFIITKQALQEGWDCPFAYVLTILSNTQSKKALTQLIGRILRQPHAEETTIDSLNESYVFCYNKAVTEVVDGIKKGLQEEGMDDLIDHVKVKNNDHKKVTVKRRKPFQDTKIFLPRVLHKAGSRWRKFVYEEDLFQHLDFARISYRKKDKFTPENIGTLVSHRITYDIEDSRGQLSLPRVHEVVIKGSMEADLSQMAVRISNIIPNPFESARILEESLEALRKNGISDEQIYLNRTYLLQDIENDLQEQIDQKSEAIFKRKLSQGEICFKIFKDSATLKWEMANEIDFMVSLGGEKTDKVLQQEDGSGLQLSLFDKTYEKHYNDYEKKVAWYLDESEAVKWWHRMVAKNDYYVQGWQKSKVYPDFLVCVNSQDLSKSKLSVLETKGDHLKGNDDTEYKKDLFKVLEKYVNHSVDVGAIETASEDEEKMVFRILMEKNWRGDIQGVL